MSSKPADTSDAANDHSTVLPDVKKAKEYIKSGGTLDAIKKKYKLTLDIAFGEDSVTMIDYFWSFK